MHIHILLTSVLSHSFSLFMVVSIIMDVLPLFYFDFLLSVVCFHYHKVKYFHAQASSDCYGRTNCSLMSICRLTELNEVQVILLRHSHYHNGRRKLKVIFGARSDFAQTNFASMLPRGTLTKRRVGRPTVTFLLLYFLVLLSISPFHFLFHHLGLAAPGLLTAT